MTNIVTLYGLRDANLAAFRSAADLVAANMDRESERSESLMREARRLLGYANRVWPIDLETADAFVARAANKVALSLGAPRV